MAQRATSLALNPPFVFVLFCFVFSFALIRTNLFFSLKRVFLLIIECLPLFLLSLFWPPPFSLPLSLSLSLSRYIPFLPSSLSFFAFFCFMKSTT